MGEYPKMEKLLYKWFISKRECNVTIDINILKEKARQMHEKIYEILNEDNMDDNAPDIEIVNDDLDDDVVIEAAPKIKHADAIEYFDRCIKWAEENNQDETDVFTLRKMQQNAYEKSASTKKVQSTIRSFFTK